MRTRAIFSLGGRLAALAVFAFTAAANAQRAVVFPAADWQESSPESQGMDSAKLKAAVAYMEGSFGTDGAKELAIVRNGYLIHKGSGVDTYHNVWSCTKTFTSTVLGVLVADGKCRLDDPAVRYLPSLDDEYPQYSRIKLRHLASMSGGYKGQVVDVTKEQPWGDPMFYLNPVASLFEAGTKVQYNDHEVVLLGRILTGLAGESMKALFKRRIADPIGFKPWDWGSVGSVNGIELNNPPGNPAKLGIETTALQMARFGYLYLNRGNWNGRQLLPASFVAEAVRNQVSLEGASSFLHGRYGFYWWTNDVMPGGKRPWPSAPPATYTSVGHGANFCFVIPEWRMVVVRMGTVGIGPLAGWNAKWDGFLARLSGALRGGSH